VRQVTHGREYVAALWFAVYRTLRVIASNADETDVLYSTHSLATRYW
jgi:hypothetical protein